MRLRLAVISLLTSALVGGLAARSAADTARDDRPVTRAEVRQEMQRARQEMREAERAHRSRMREAQRRYDAARRLYELAGRYEAAPPPRLSLRRARALVSRRRYDAAIEMLAAITAADPQHARAFMLYGYALHAAGRLDDALIVHRAAARFPEVRAIALYNVACVHALEGKRDRAFAALEQSIRAGYSGTRHMRRDPDLASLRSDSRFAAAIASARANARRR
jgi:tetratricopeptide (TPR) repeat protein